MEAVDIIKSEHRSLAVVLSALEELIAEIEAGKQPDFNVFHGIVTYVDRFLNTYHHPKEDTYLMPILRMRYSQSAQLIAEIYNQHETGDDLFSDMVKALSAYEFSMDLSFSGFNSAARKFIEFERMHGTQEEEQVLPLCIAHFTESDWEVVDGAFTENEDPLFGTQSKDMFRNLFTAIVNRTPEPHGLGKQWPELGAQA